MRSFCSGELGVAVCDVPRRMWGAWLACFSSSSGPDALEVWKEYQAEQVVQRRYEAKIAEPASQPKEEHSFGIPSDSLRMITQFEDDAAELMHVSLATAGNKPRQAQGLKIYHLRVARVPESCANCA